MLLCWFTAKIFNRVLLWLVFIIIDTYFKLKCFINMKNFFCFLIRKFSVLLINTSIEEVFGFYFWHSAVTSF